MWSGMTKRCKMRHFFFNLHPYLPSFMSKIGFILMQSQDHDLFRNVYFHYIISNSIFKWNIRGPKIGPFQESIYLSSLSGTAIAGHSNQIVHTSRRPGNRLYENQLNCLTKSLTLCMLVCLQVHPSVLNSKMHTFPTFC